MTLAVDPPKLRVQPVTRRPEEVCLRLVEAHAPVNVAELVGEADHETEEEGRVGDLVGDARPAGEGAVLDAEVGDPVDAAVAQTVPPVDGAAVQVEGGQLGQPPALQDGLRILFERTAADDRAEARDVLAEQLEGAPLEPALPEVHPRVLALLPAVRPARVHRALEQGHPGLAPKAPPEQSRRVHRHREQGGDDRLGEVVLRAHLRGLDLQVQLQRGVAGLEHHVRVGEIELVEAADQHLEVTPPARSGWRGPARSSGPPGSCCRSPGPRP